MSKHKKRKKCKECREQWSGRTLSGIEILREVERRRVSIHPFVPEQVSQFSVDLHLHPKLLRYSEGRELDLAKPCDDDFLEILIPEEGYVLRPGQFYLGATIEEIYAPGHLVRASGKSSPARKSLNVEAAGLVEPGFRGPITLEIFSIAPLRVYPGSPIAQITLEPANTAFQDYSVRGNYKDCGNKPGPTLSRSHRHVRRHHVDLVG